MKKQKEGRKTPNFIGTFKPPRMKLREDGQFQRHDQGHGTDRRKMTEGD